VPRTTLLKQIATLIFVAACFHPANASETDSITLAWQWDAGNTGYRSGPNGDIAFHLYMRTHDDAGYDYDYPSIAGIDDCWSDNDLYNCQVTLTHAFEPGIRYFLAVAAYRVDDPTAVSSLSNEIEYTVAMPGEDTGSVDDVQDSDDAALNAGQDDADGNSSSPESSGGGCFITSSLTPLNRTQ
jgi:hypothetical protein